MRSILLVALISFNLSTWAQKHYLFVGTYTNKGSKGIYVYQFDAKDASLKLLSHTDSVPNPSYLALSANGKYLYTVNENGGKTPGAVSSFSFNRKTAQLHFINKQTTGSDHPCYITVSKKNNWLFAGNYSGGSFSVFPLSENGEVQAVKQLVKHYGSSIVKSRQNAPHVHATVLTPDEKRLFVTDLGTDKIVVYPVNANDINPIDTTKKKAIQTEPGSGPRHFEFHPNRKFGYLVEEMTGTVSVFSINKDSIVPLQRISSHPNDYKGGIGSADIHVSPDGKFLYVSNRGDANNIAIFSITSDGKLATKGFQSTLGKKPRNFVIDPTGNYLLVANQETNNIVVFKRDKRTGLLSETGNSIEVPTPVCLKMLK